MNEILISILLVMGSFFMLVAGLGMMRMPDLFLRMSCSTKAATIGIGTLLFALALYFANLGVATRAGARRVEYAQYGQDGTVFAGEVEEERRMVLEEALGLRTMGLAETPQTIAWEMTTIEVGYGSPGNPYASPFVDGREHSHPTMAARALVPIRVWMFDITLAVISETEVR